MHAPGVRKGLFLIYAQTSKIMQDIIHGVDFENENYTYLVIYNDYSMPYVQTFSTLVCYQRHKTFVVMK